MINALLFQCSTSEAEWRQIGKEFEERWQFPNCLGCIDGKHIRIIAPQDSGSFYWNYKGYNSLVLISDGYYRMKWTIE